MANAPGRSYGATRNALPCCCGAVDCAFDGMNARLRRQGDGGDEQCRYKRCTHDGCLSCFMMLWPKLAKTVESSHSWRLGCKSC
jgi:hypothetical protein